MRWTTGIGIVIGGVGGAMAALMGSPKAPPVAPSPVLASAAPVAVSATGVVPSAMSAAPSAAAGSAVAETASIIAGTAAPAPSLAAAAPAPSVAAAPTPSPAMQTAPALELPTTQAGLLKAEMLCDQKKDFDECARAAEALEEGTSAAADPEQGKRFRKIALTHLVMQCESGSPHACFVLAAKYRAGTELTASTNSADTLEKRALELCHKRTAPECPVP